MWRLPRNLMGSMVRLVSCSNFLTEFRLMIDRHLSFTSENEWSSALRSLASPFNSSSK